MAEDPKENILNAAADEFSEKGKAGARMQAIADKAGVNKAMLNYYFTSKDQLFYAVMKKMLTEAQESALNELKDIDDAREFIHEFVRHQQDKMISNPSWIKLIMQNYLHGDAETIKLLKDDKLFSFFFSKLKRFSDRGEIRVDKISHLIMLIMGINLVSIMAHSDFKLIVDEEMKKDMELKDFLQTHQEVLIDVLENGLFTH